MRLLSASASVLSGSDVRLCHRRDGGVHAAHHRLGPQAQLQDGGAEARGHHPLAASRLQNPGEGLLPETTKLFIVKTLDLLQQLYLGASRQSRLAVRQKDKAFFQETVLFWGGLIHGHRKSWPFSGLGTKLLSIIMEMIV